MMALLKCFLLFALLAFVLADEKKDDTENDVELETRGGPAISLADRVAKLEAKLRAILYLHGKYIRGRDGRDGMPGRAGKDGKDGRDGPRGPRGPAGPRGKSGLNGARGPAGRDGGGLQYTRWGKTECSGGAELVYKGRMAGEHYSHKGGGVNYLCVTEKPKFLRTKPGWQSSARLYGTEYEVSTYSYGIALFGKHLHDHDAPCAVCYVKTRSAKLMIPGTYKCPAGWTNEYFGYLMTEHYGHPHPRDFVCVDRKAEVAKGGHANHNGALLYTVEATCGSLPCPPYANAKEIACAVCTK